MAKASLRQCFMCGKDISIGDDSGQMTFAGFFDRNNFPYYNQINLCKSCHIDLYDVITRCLYSNGKEVDNGNASNPR